MRGPGQHVNNYMYTYVMSSPYRVSRESHSPFSNSTLVHGDVVVVDLSELADATLVKGCRERRSVEINTAVVVKGALSDGSSQPHP